MRPFMPLLALCAFFFATPALGQLSEFSLVDLDFAEPPGFFPGTQFRYVTVLEVDPATGQLENAELVLPIPSLTTIVPGTATTTHGSITSGNGAADTELRVDLGTLITGDPVTTTVDVEISSPYPTCSPSFFTRASLTADSIPPQESNDPDAPPGTFSTNTLVDLFSTSNYDITIQESNLNGLADPGEVLTFTIELSQFGSLLYDFFRWDLTSLTNASLLPGTVTVDHPDAVVLTGNDPSDTSVAVAIEMEVGSTNMMLSFDVVVDNPPAMGAVEVALTGLFSRPCIVPTSMTAALPLVPLTHDLGLTKTDGGIVANAGDTIVYRLDVSNGGNQIASGVFVSETVPADTTFNAAASGADWICTGTDPGSLCTLTLGNLTPSSGLSINFAVDVDDPLAAGVTQITNSASVGDDGLGGPDTNPFNNTDTDTTPIDSGPGGTGPDLAVTKTDGGATTGAGQVIAYTLTVANNGNQNTAGVVLADSVPAHTSFDSASSDPAWVCGTLTCTLPVGDLTADGSAQSFTIAFTVDDPLAAGVTEISNTAAVTDDGLSGPDLNAADNSDTDTTPIDSGPGGTGPDLIVTKTDGGATTGAGQVITYTLTVANNGNQNTGGVVLADSVPVHTSFDSAGSDPAWACSASACTLPVGDLVADGSAQSFPLAFTVDDPLAAGVTEISNTASVTDDGLSGPDLNAADNTDTDTTPIDSGPGGTGPDLIVTKTDGGATTGAGRLIAYTLTVANNGNQNTAGVALADSVPAHTSFNSAGSNPAWTCASTCTLPVGNLTADGSAQSFTIAFTVDDPLAAGVTEISNTVSVTDDGLSGPDLNAADNTDTDTTPIDSGPGGTGPDLIVTKTDGGATSGAGQLITYTLTVTNNGNQNTGGVVLADSVPAHTSFDSAGSDPAWACSASACTLPVGDLVADGSAQSFALAFTVDDPLAAGVREISNTASVTDDGLSGPDVNTADNTATDTTPIDSGPGGTGPDLIVTKTDGGTTTGAGQLVTYTVTVANNGNQNAGGVVLADSVPAHTSFNSAGSDPAWACSTSTCTLLVGALTADGSAQSFALALTVDDPLAAGVTEISNTVSVTDDGLSGPDLNAADNTDTDTTPIDSGPGGTGPDLIVTKTDGGTTTGAGQLITYTLTVANNGNQNTGGVALTDSVPEHTSFNSANSDPAWACSASTCTLPVGDLTADGSAQIFTIAFTVDDPLAAGVTEISNTASVTDDGLSGPDLNTADNTATDNTPIDSGPGGTAPDLIVTKTDGGATTGAGQLTTYTVTVANNGNQNATGVVLSDSLPSHTTFNAAGSDLGWSCTSTCNLAVGDLAAGGSGESFTIAFIVDDPLAAGVTEISNTVSVTDDGLSGPDLNATDNTDTDTTPIDSGPGGTGPDLIVTKADGGATTGAGGLIAYTLTVANNGNQNTTGVALTDSVPEHTSFNSAGSDPAWACSASACTLPFGDLTADASAQSFTIAFTVDDPLAAGVTEISNTASATDDGLSGPDLNTADNTATDTTPVDTGPGGTGPDLIVTKTDGGATTGAGQLVTYTLSVANNGNQNTSGVVLTDSVPTHTSFNSAGSNPAWTCSSSTCTLPVGDLTAGGSAQSFTIAFTVDDPLAAGVTEISNTVSVTDDGLSGPDLNADDNFAVEQTPIDSGGTAPDLRIRKDDGGISTMPGGLVAYSLSVVNVGNQDAAGVVLSDTIPAHTAFDVKASDPGWSCSTSICTLDIGVLNVGEPERSLTLTFRVEKPLDPEVLEIFNSVSAADDGTSGPDLNPDDNVADETTPVVSPPDDMHPDLLVIKNDAGVIAGPGDLIVYTIAVANIGTEDATGVVLEDVVPPHTIFDAAASDAGWSCPGIADECTLDVGNVGIGQEVLAYDFAVRLEDPLPPELTEIANTATVTDDGSHGPDLDPANNTDTAVTPVMTEPQGPDLVVTKDDGGIEVSAGDLIAYSIGVANIGTVSSSGVVLEDIVPRNTLFDLANSDSRWSCSEIVAGSVCSLQVGDVAAGQVLRPFVFSVRVEDETSPDDLAISNTASVSDDGTSGADLDPTNNSGSDQTPIVPPDGGAPDLVALKVDRVLDPGSNDLELIIEYLVIIENHGDADALEVVYSPESDPHTTYIPGSASTTQGEIVEFFQPPFFRVLLGSIAPGEEPSITFAVSLDLGDASGLDFVECQGQVTGLNFSELVTDDPDTPEPDDPTRTDLSGVGAAPVAIPTLSPLGVATFSGLLILAVFRRFRRGLTLPVE